MSVQLLWEVGSLLRNLSRYVPTVSGRDGECGGGGGGC